MLDDLLTRHLDVVVCGTGAGRRSAKLRQYYAGPGNRFWRTLAKGQAGSDDQLRLRKADAIALQAKVVLYQPRYLCFNGKRAAREFFRRPELAYGVQPERIGRTVLFVAPSTSRAASASWDLSIWHDLAARVRGRKSRPSELPSRRRR